jgi:hypothetical protein
VLIANTPQVLVSLTYLFYNATLTTMLAEHEWHTFTFGALPVLPLRVSQPRGKQRTTFFLSLPYRYGLPLLVLTTAMHWLASQSLFSSDLDQWTIDGDGRNASSITALSYSSLAIFWMLVLGTSSWVAMAVLAVARVFPAGMPLLGASSAVIAASCHLPAEIQECGGDVASEALSWGVAVQVTHEGGISSDGGKVERWLGFVPGKAEEPVVGEVYG